MTNRDRTRESGNVRWDDRSALKTFYRTSEGYRRGLQEREADSFHAEYLRMVHTYVPMPAQLLDLGCGTGYSSYRLAQQGYDVVGIDISDMFLDGASSRSAPGLCYTVGDALELPFSDSVYDAVSSFDMIEHVADVERVLKELDRILRPGGRFVLVCPNYWSPVIPLKALLNLLKGGPGYLSFYESMPAALKGIGQTAWQSLRKIQSSGVRFLYRTPRLEGLVDADCDCVYLPSPVDFRKYFKQAGYRIVRYNREGSSRLRRLFATLVPSFTPTVYFVAEKSKKTIRDQPLV